MRDLYDIFFLLRFAEDKKPIAHSLREFLKGFHAPDDAGDMKALIISGAVPSVNNMLEEIALWAK